MTKYDREEKGEFTEKDVIFSSISPALTFKCYKIAKYARRSQVILPHGTVNTPVFMPVGTQGTMKGVLNSELQKKKNVFFIHNTKRENLDEK